MAMDHLTHHLQSNEVVDDFVGAAAANQIHEELFIEHLNRSAQLAKMTPLALLAEVKRRVADDHYNDVMLGSLPDWIRPVFGLEPRTALV